MKSNHRKPILCLAAAALLALSGALGGVAHAQDWPNKPIRLIVPVPPGAGPDVDARQITARLTPLLGQPVIIDNRPGASTRIAIEAAVKSAPDGYTFLVGTPSLVTAPSLYAKLPFDGKRDLVPVSLLSTTSYLLTVNAAVPAGNPAAFVALTKSNPNYAQVATLGVGTLPHLAGAWFGSAAGADFKFIHYNTTAPFNDLLSGQTAAIFDAILPVMGNLKAGKLRALAISGNSRHPLLPEVPTFAEAGIKGFDPMVWIGVLAPAGTPRPIIDRMSVALSKVAKLPEIVAFRRDAGSQSIGSTPEEYGAFLDAERAKWGAVIEKIGLKLEEIDLGIAGRKALVAASSSGLGLACAAALAREGCKVWINGRDAGRLEKARSQISGQVETVAGDINTEAGRAALLAACPEPDILVNNNAGPPPGKLEDWDHAAWLAALEANMLAPVLLIRAVVPGMRARRFGRVVNITSAMVKSPRPSMALSSAARTGLTAFAKALSLEAAADNVTLNNLLPERIDTPRQGFMAERMMKAQGIDREEARRRIAQSVAAKRFGTPAEFADACAFLCSAQAGFISGQNLQLDGGSYPGLL